MSIALVMFVACLFPSQKIHTFPKGFLGVG